MTVKTLEPVPNILFQVAWESTLKCNLDCSYCGDGHDNSTEHPSLEESIKTVDFIVEYLNLYMSIKPEELKHASLNIQGGESLFHPNIVEILTYARSLKTKYSDWKLNISMITNAICGKTRWKEVVDLIDYFTISYHSESLEKQQQMFRDNVLYLKEKNKNFHVAVIMHPKHWQNCINIIEWCKQHNVKYTPRQIDHHWMDRRFNYNEEQSEFLIGKKKITITEKIIHIFKNGIDLSAEGRSCCGNNCLKTNGMEETYRVDNKFKNWYCSVNQFFLYIRQTTGEIFTNKDCKMNLEGNIAPLGFLKNSDEILSKLKYMVETKTLPTIICKKSSCWCGLCSPKAKAHDTFIELLKKYNI